MKIKKTKFKDIMLYANTTNGPKYDNDFCVVCNNRAEQKDFVLTIKKE